MRRHVLELAIAAVLLAGCTGRESSTGGNPGSVASTCPAPNPVDITLTADNRYAWRGERLEAAQVQSRIEDENQRCHITEVHLHRGEGKMISIAHTLEVGQMAQAVNARAYAEQDGECKEIVFVGPGNPLAQ